MLIQKLEKQGLIQPPKWLADNCAYLTVMGSVAYGVSRDSSDEDIYGFCLPPKDLVFPHLAGEIPGFGTQLKRFEVWQQHHIKTPDGAKEYDFAIYSIVKYFQLCMENNPNMIDSLFTPERCVKHITEVGRMIRDRRRSFLHRGAWHKFKGYAYSQLHKIEIKRQNAPAVVDFREYCAANGFDPAVPRLFSASEEYVRLWEAVMAQGKRFEDIARHGYDVKFAYHVVRLVNEVEQIMIEGDLDLQRNREQLKAIRRGEWSQSQLVEWFEQKERDLETVYTNSTLPAGPDEKAVKQLLLDCLEHHYGDISTAVSRDASVEAVVRDLDAVLARYRG